MESNIPVVELDKNIETNQPVPVTTSNNNDNTNEDEKLSQKKRMIIIIIIILSVIIIVFIFILIFVILKSSKKKIPIIMDVDEGGDDMVTYIIAQVSEKYDILGLTTVSPDHYIDNVTDIWLRFLEYMDFDSKVYKGENQPLVRKTEPAVFSHDYQIDFPSTKKTIEKESAVDFMYNTIKDSKEKITLFLLAPLTNFAKVLQRDPSIIKNVEEIIIMGGTKGDGNIPVNMKSEYNIYCDAEAANIVFNCGAKVKVFGTDVTHKVEFTDEIYEKYLKFNTRASKFTYDVMKGTFITWNDNYLHDPVTILYHLNNDIIQLKEYYCQVNTTNPDVEGTDYGTMYFIEPDQEHKANIEYSESINLDLYWKDLDYYVQQY